MSNLIPTNSTIDRKIKNLNFNHVCKDISCEFFQYDDLTFCTKLVKEQLLGKYLYYNFTWYDYDIKLPKLWAPVSKINIYFEIFEILQINPHSSEYYLAEYTEDFANKICSILLKDPEFRINKEKLVQVTENLYLYEEKHLIDLKNILTSKQNFKNMLSIFYTKKGRSSLEKYPKIKRVNHYEEFKNLRNKLKISKFRKEPLYEKYGS